MPLVQQREATLVARGATPDEVYFGLEPAREAPRFEPRKRFPLEITPSGSAPTAVRGKRGARLELVTGTLKVASICPLSSSGARLESALRERIDRIHPRRTGASDALIGLRAEGRESSLMANDCSLESIQ